MLGRPDRSGRFSMPGRDERPGWSERPVRFGMPNRDGRPGRSGSHLKGLSHEIFMVIFWLEWIYIGLKGGRFWFLNFEDVSSILDSNFKY
jgi:hypothetical protein